MKVDTTFHGLPGCTDNAVEIVGFENMMMCDWDMPHESHLKASSVTIPNREYVIGILNRDVHQNPHHAWRLYQTPAGCRAFLVSRWDKFTVRRDIEHMANLGCDPSYRKLTQARGVWNCRIGPKPGRKDDWVARYWKSIDGVRAEDNDKCMEALDTHNKLCARPKPDQLMVRVQCRLCKIQVEKVVWDDGSIERSYAVNITDKTCKLCLGRRNACIALPKSHEGFLDTVAAKQAESVDLLAWSDLMSDDGMPEYVIENLRIISPADVEVIVEGHGTPKPVIGGFTNWSKTPF